MLVIVPAEEDPKDTHTGGLLSTAEIHAYTTMFSEAVGGQATGGLVLAAMVRCAASSINSPDKQ